MHDAEIREIVSAVGFEATLDRLTAALGKAGLMLFAKIDHQAGAREAGLAMPPATVLIYGHPKGGTPVMVAAPCAALDLPLRVLVRVRDAGKKVIGFHQIAAVLRRAGVPDELARRLEPAQEVLVAAVLVAAVP